MAMTADDMVAFFGEQADGAGEGILAAQSASDYYLAAVNCAEGFKCRLMQGLITWRMGRNPTEHLCQAVRQFRNDWQAVMTIGGEAANPSDAAFEQVPFVAYLIGEPLPFAVDPSVTSRVECDRLLDAVLGRWLFDTWDASDWQQGLEELRRKGSQLAVETYELYSRMTQASHEELPRLAEEAATLFSRRKKDAFFAGGVQTAGGGPDNDFTVDYRFAALAKRVGYNGDSIHCWCW
jgi:hypothetical protein